MVYIHIAQTCLDSMRTWKSLLSVLNITIRTFSFIMARALNYRHFKMFCDDIARENSTFILHTECGWLSHGKVVMTEFQLRLELQLSLYETETTLAKYFWDVPCLQELAYLADIFNKLDYLNLSMQNCALIWGQNGRSEVITCILLLTRATKSIWLFQ